MPHDEFPEDLAIRVRDVGKTYHLGVINRHTLRDEFLYRWLRLRGRDPKSSLGRIGGRELSDPGLFHALDGVSFDIRKGETVGLIGRNGAGKSTMLKILARITTPTTGDAWIRGRVGSMLEVGTGFHPELTGRENIYLNGTILGMSKREIDAKFDEIVEFSEIGDFLDTPVKRYSSGMYVKLAFSIASSLDNDVLLLDEVLAVGDAAFRRKSLARMKEIAASGRTILFVSHAMGNIREICTRCLWFDHGRIVRDGPTDEVAATYEGLVAKESESAVHAFLKDIERPAHASGKIRFEEISLLDGKGHESIPASGEFLMIRLAMAVSSDVRKADLSLGIRDSQGIPLMTFPTFMTAAGFSFHPGTRIVELSIPRLPLTQGSYSIGLYAAADGADSDFIVKALSFDVQGGDFFGHGAHIANSLKGHVVLCDHHWNART